MTFCFFRGFGGFGWCRFCVGRDQRGRPPGPPRVLRVRFPLEWKQKTINYFRGKSAKIRRYHKWENTVQISLRKFRNLKFSISPNLLLSGRGATRACLDVQKRVLNARPRGSEPRTLYLNCMVLSRQSTGTQRNFKPTKSRSPQNLQNLKFGGQGRSEHFLCYLEIVNSNAPHA